VYVNIRVGYSNHLGNTATDHQIFKRNRASAAFNGCVHEEYIEDENTIILLVDKEIMHIAYSKKKHMWLRLATS
jgi:hypothetical protein